MTHLTEEQIDELLMGSLEAAQATQVREHAAGCEACAAKLAEIEAPIERFKAVSLAWSERRSATLPVRPAAKRAGARVATGFAWGSLAAAALLAAIIPVLRHEQDARVREAYHNAANTQGTNQTATAATPSEAPATSSATGQDNAATDVPENALEIANDNRLLAMVDEELNAPIAAPGTKAATPGHSHSPNAHGSVQD